MAWRRPEPRLARRCVGVFGLAAVLGMAVPLAPGFVGGDRGWTIGNMAFAGGKRDNAGAAGGAGYRGRGAGGSPAGEGAGSGGGVGPAPGAGAAGAAPGDSKAGPGGGAAGSVDSRDSSRAAQVRGSESHDQDRGLGPIGSTSTGPSQPTVRAPLRSNDPVVPTGLTQVGDDLSPAEEAALIAGKWR